MQALVGYSRSPWSEPDASVPASRIQRSTSGCGGPPSQPWKTGSHIWALEQAWGWGWFLVQFDREPFNVEDPFGGWYLVSGVSGGNWRIGGGTVSSGIFVPGS